MLHSARGEALALALRSSSCALPGDAGEGKLKASAFSAMAAARRSERQGEFVELVWACTYPGAPYAIQTGSGAALGHHTLPRRATAVVLEGWHSITAGRHEGRLSSPVCELYKVIVQCAQPEFAAPEAPHCEMGTKGSPPLSVVTGANSGVGEWLYKTYS